jgi:hypothetical protein
MKFPDECRPQIFAVSRMVFGFLFAMHGLKNAFDMFGGPPAQSGIREKRVLEDWRVNDEKF